MLRAIIWLPLVLMAGFYPPTVSATSDDSGLEAWWVFISPEACDDEAGRTLVTQRSRARREARAVLADTRHLDQGPGQATLEQIRATGVTVRTVSHWLDAVSVEADRASLERLRNLPFVSGTRRVAAFPRADLMEDDAHEAGGQRLEYGESQGQLEMLRVPEAHDMGYSGAGVLVLMLDTGYYKDHVALDTSRIVAEWDFVNGDGNTQNEGNDVENQHRHGTATSTALGGHWPGMLYGPAYGCDFLLAKTEDTTSETPVEEDYYAAALEWGEALGADVASSSLGYTAWYSWEDLDGETSLVAQSVNIAVSLGLAVVTSAGNYRDNDWGHIGSPADAFGVISVGAVYPDESITTFSSPGPTYDGRLKPEVSAQGSGVAAAGWSDPENLRYFSGTSLSCPLVAGCVALLLEAHPEWGPADLRWALMSTADRAASPDNDYGWGIIDVVAALDAEPMPGPLSLRPSGANIVLEWPASPYQLMHVHASTQPWSGFERVASLRDTSWTDSGALNEATRYYQLRGE